MEVEDVLESNESSQDSRLKSVSVEINSFKRHFPVKPLNGENSNKDFADIMSMVNTIKAVSSAYQGTDKGDHQILHTDTTNKHQRDSLCKKLNGGDQNNTAVGEPESKRAKLHCDRTYRENDFQTIDKSDKTPDESGSSDPHENGTSSKGTLELHTERMPDNGNTLETSCSGEGELELRLEIETTPEKSDTDEQDDLNYKVKKTAEDYSTPIKNDLCSEEEARRSPFLIGDKIRNSLKGIVEKVKSSPDHKRNLGSCLDDKEDRVLKDVLVGYKLSEQDSLSQTPDRKLEESTGTVKTCDKDNEKTSSKLEVTTVQSDNIDNDNVKDQNKHIPTDSVRLKENDPLNKSLDDQDLLLGIEDDTQIDISSDKEDELLQDNSSSADKNDESVVFLRTEINDLDKNTDLTSKFDGSHISGNPKTNISDEDKSVGIKSILPSLEGSNNADKNLGIDTQETLSREENTKEVISEKERSDTNASVNIPNQSCDSSETNLGSNENRADKEVDVKNSNSVHSQCTKTSSPSPTENLEACDKDAKVKNDDEDDVIFEGFDEPKVTNEESTKSNQLNINNSCKDKVSKNNILDATKDANNVCETTHCDSDMKTESKNITAKNFVKCKPISSTDSDINLIEEDEVDCKERRQSISTDSESITYSTSKSDSKILDQKVETADVKSCEKKAEPKSSSLNEIEQKEDQKDNGTDDDDDVIFEGVVKPTDSKIDESSNDIQDNTGLGNETKVDTTTADEESKTISKTDDEECKFKDGWSSMESSNSASDKIESLSDTKMSVEEEDDDDVIFEGVDRPDNTETEKERTESTDSLTSNSQPVSEVDDKNSKTTTKESDKIETKAANDLGEEADKEIIYDRVATQTSTNINSESEVKSSVKRRAEESSEHDSNPKRTRLDEVIGKLGSQIGVEPESIEVSESDDDEEESATDTAVEEKSEDTSDNDNEDDESNSEYEKVKYVKITEKELEELVRERVAAYLASQRETIIAQLTQKVKDLQVSNDQWKSQVKELQVKVTDVTVLNLKHEKRKAATAALRQITTRSVSVQVDEGKTAVSQRATPKTPEHTVNMVKSPLQKTMQQNPVPLVTAPPGSNGTIRLPIPQSAIAPPVLAPQMPQLPHPPATISTTHYQTPTVKTLLDTTRQQITSGSLTKTSPATSMVSTTPQVVHYPQRVAAQSKTGFVTAAPQIPSSQVVGSSAVPVASKNIGPTTQMTSATGTTTLKVIDLTADEGDNRQPKVLTLPAAQVHTLNQLRSVVPNQQPQQFVLNQNGQLIQTSLSGSQGQAFQLVFNTSTPALRTGNVPQTGTVLQTVAQPNLTTQGTMGTQQMVTQVPGQAMLRPPTSSSQITSLLSQTKLKETANTIRAPTTVFEEQIKPALRKKLETNSPASVVSVHPAPLPLMPVNQHQVGLKLLPPKPSLKISRVSQGIVLSWNMTINDTHEEIASYQLYAYQEGTTPPTTALWKKVGDVKALPLPMACTLTQFQVGNKYHFAVRAVDVNARVGHFSEYSSIHLTPLPTPPGGKS